MENTAIIPATKLEEDFYGWEERHETKKALAAQHQFDLVFVGDSITHLLEGDPDLPNGGQRYWKEFYQPRNALNLGFGWDRTQNVLWRLQNGEFDNQKPKLIVVNIGTNNQTGTENARTNTPEEIAEGIKAICSLLHNQSPDSQILLMGIFPRGTPDDPLRESIREINAIIANLAELPYIEFMDIGDQFLEKDGTISTEIMADSVHPTEKGYKIWVDAIEPVVRKCL